MKLMCAWCQQEGVPAFLCEVEPIDDPTETHGICARHRFEVLQELDTAQASAVAAPTERFEAVDEGELLNRWIASSREMFETVLPGLLAAGASLAKRAESAERTRGSLEVQLTALRRDVTDLQRQRQELNNMHTEIADVVNDLVGRLARDVIQPLYDLMAKLNRISVWAALCVAPWVASLRP